MLQGLENNLKLQTIEIANNKIAKLDGENNIHINLATFLLLSEHLLNIISISVIAPRYTCYILHQEALSHL